MQTLRLFISSPGDVAEERDRARQVIEGLRRHYAGVFHLKPVLWEDLPLQAGVSFQEGIDAVLTEEGGIAVAVFILWSRMGQLQDGGTHRSGTEREFELMLAARERSGGQRPALFVYCREDDASFEERLRGRSTPEQRDLIEQKVQVEQFIVERFQDAETGRNLRAYHRFDRPQTFSQRLRVHLTELLDDLAGGEASRPVWDIERQGSPFLGLEAFQARHAAVFFGREDEVLEARRALGVHAREGGAFLLITGASGSGKSSLARAGLLPAIVEQELDDSVAEWRTLTVVPSELGVDPVATLVERLAAPDLLPALRAEGVAFDEVVGAFRRGDSGGDILLKQAVAAATRSRGGGVRVLLLVDQMEEIFALSRRAELTAFLERLARSGAVWVVATVRSDFLGDVHGEPVLARLLEGRPVLTVLPPEPDALRRMIEEPARLSGLHFEARGERRLSDQILADAARHADLLPLVEFVLWRLHEQRTAEGRLSWKVYEEDLQGVVGALRLQAEGVYERLAADPEAQAALPGVLKRLVTVGEAAGGPQDGAERFLRQRMPLATFPAGSPSRRLVEALVRARLLTADEGSTVTVAHEALLRAWPRAATWAEANRDLLRTRARVESRMRENQASTIAEGDPLLEVAKVHLAADPEAFTEGQRAFIEGSVSAAEANRVRRERLRRRVMAGLSALTLLALAGAGWAMKREREAETARREAEAERQKTQVQLERSQLEEGRAWFERAKLAWEGEKNPLKALMFAGRAVGFHGFGRRENESPDLAVRYPSLLGKPMTNPGIEESRLQEEKAVREYAAQITPTGLPIWSSAKQQQHQDSVTSVAFSSDGGRLASGSRDSTIKLWNVACGKEVVTLKGHILDVTSVAFSPDGNRLASGSWDRDIKLWDVASGKELATLKGHSHAVTSVAFSPDGSRLATGSANSTVKLWDLVSGKEVATLEGHSGAVTSVAFSPDGTRLASGSRDESIKLWDTASGKELANLEGHSDDIASVAFSPDGSRLASGSIDRTIKLWNSASGKELATLADHSFGIFSVAFSPDGRLLASGSLDYTIKLWDLASRKEILTIEGHALEVNSLAFSPDGNRLASGSGDSTVKLWDVPSGKEVAILEGHALDVTSVAFSPDGSRLASGAGDYAVKVWDAASGKELATLKGHFEAITSVVFSPDGRHLVSGSWDNTIKLWDAASGKEVVTLLRHTEGVRSVAFSPDGSRLASGAMDRTVKIWDVANGKVVVTILGHQGGVNSVAFSPDGSRLASGSDDKTIKLWDAASGHELATLEGHALDVTSVAFSPDGSRLASGAIDRTIKLWDTASGQELATLEGHSEPVNSVAFCPDGSRLASACGDNTVKLWDVVSGKVVATLQGHAESVDSVAFSPDGSRLASGAGDDTVKVWDVAGGKELATLEGHSGAITSVAFSPDGSRLASGAIDRTIKLWDTTSGKEMAILQGHSDDITSVAFSPDGACLASGSSDESIKLWDTASGKEMAILQGHSDDITSVAFSPDGNRLASGCGDYKIKLWDVASGKELATLEGHSERVNSVIFSPDGSRLASGADDRTIKFWDVVTGKLLVTIQIQDYAAPISSLAFSPDGSRLAAGSGDDTVKIWDVVSGKDLATLQGSDNLIAISSSSCVAFSPDGSRVAAGSGNYVVKVWNAASGKELANLQGHSGGVTDVAFSPDGSRLASGSADGTVKLWDIKSGSELLGKPDFALLSDLGSLSPGRNRQSTTENEVVYLEPAPEILNLLELERAGYFSLKDREVIWNTTNDSLFASRAFPPVHSRPDLLAQLGADDLTAASRMTLRIQLSTHCAAWRILPILLREAQDVRLDTDPDVRRMLLRSLAIALRTLATADKPDFPTDIWSLLVANLTSADFQDSSFTLPLAQALPSFIKEEATDQALVTSLSNQIISIAPSSWLDAVASSLSEASENEIPAVTARRQAFLSEVRVKHPDLAPKPKPDPTRSDR